MGLITSLLIKHIAAPLVDVIATELLGEAAGKLGVGLTELSSSYFQNEMDRRKAERSIREIADEIIEKLAVVFESDGEKSINTEAVAFEIGATLSAGLTASELLEAELIPARVYEMFKSRHAPNPALFSSAEMSIYDRAIQQLARSCCSIATKFPDFEVRNTQIVLSRLRQLAESSNRLLASIERIESAVDKLDQTEPRRRYEADYRTAVVRNLDRLDIFGIDIADQLRGYPLSIAYVNLTLAADTQQQIASAATLLSSLEQKGKRLLLKGEAGCGKTTFFRWIAIRAAEGQPIIEARPWSIKSANWLSYISKAFTGDRVIREAVSSEMPDNLANTQLHSSTALLKKWRTHIENTEQRDWWSRVPFLITLRECKDGNLPSPDELPRLIAKEIGAPPADWVRDILSAGRGLILFDGVDEISNAHRASLKHQLNSIIDAYPDNMFLVSGRPAAIPDGWLQNKGFSEAIVNPMSDDGIVQFIQNWHEAAFHILAAHNISEDTSALATNLTAILESNNSLKRIASTPLVCAAICALHRNRKSYLPERPTEIFDALCSMLLHRRDEERGINLDALPEAYRGFSFDEKRVVVRGLAHYMVRNAKSRIERSDATIQVERIVASLPRHREASAEAVLTAFIERSGMLRAPTNTQVEFIHNTFKEYLAADVFVDENDYGQLAINCLDPSWQPVVLFAVATTKQDFSTRLLKAILERRDQTAGNHIKRSLNILAIRCRAAALTLDPKIQQETDDLIKRLFPPRTLSEAIKLAEAGDAAVPFLTKRNELKAREAASCVRALSEIRTKSAIQAAKTYVSDRRWTVISELVNIVDPLSIPTYREAFIEGKVPWDLRKYVKSISPLLSPPYDRRILGLDLTGTSVQTLAGAEALQELGVLNISRTGISDITPLGGAPNLYSLFISRTPISSLKPLAAHQKLKMLSAFQCQNLEISDIGLLKNLRRLAFSALPESNLDFLSQLQELLALDISSRTVDCFKSLPQMSEALLLLEIETDETFDHESLNRYQHLEYLVLSGSYADAPKVLRQLNLPNLRVLGVAGENWAKITEADIASLPRLESIVGQWGHFGRDRSLAPAGDLGHLFSKQKAQEVYNTIAERIFPRAPK